LSASWLYDFHEATLAFFLTKGVAIEDSLKNKTGSILMGRIG